MPPLENFPSFIVGRTDAGNKSSRNEARAQFAYACGSREKGLEPFQTIQSVIDNVFDCKFGPEWLYSRKSEVAFLMSGVCPDGYDLAGISISDCDGTKACHSGSGEAET
jgi:hypothetical protein